MSRGVGENTDRVIWRRECEDYFDKAFAPRIAITRDGNIAISDGSKTVTMSAESWVELGWLHLTAGISDVDESA